VTRTFRARARLAIADERAIAIPVALAILFLVWGLATVSLRSALASQSQSQRDRDVKRALQAATAGIDAAMYRLNLLQPESLQCITVSAGTLAVSAVPADGWCPEEMEELSDAATYRMRVSRGWSLHANGQSLVQRQIVSTGASGGVRRRVLARITAATGEPVFPGGYAGVSLTALDVGNNVDITGGLGTNGNILLKNYAQVCGNTTPGPGKSLSIQNSASVCNGYSVSPTTTPFNLQPVDQGNAPTVNDNGRIGDPPAGTSADPCSSCGNISWDPSTRILSLRQNSTLTLGGNVYSFCRLDLDNTAQLKIAARALGTSVRIYMDSPENCGGGSGMGSVSVRNDSAIVNMNTIPTTLQLYVVGSPSIATSVDLANGVTLETDLVMAIYAPYSTVTMRNNTRLVGAIAARSLVLQNNATLTYNERIADITTGSPLRLYRLADYKECGGDQTTAAIDSGC
jgi:Tfp pilus assembly protein PilX